MWYCRSTVLVLQDYCYFSFRKIKFPKFQISAQKMVVIYLNPTGNTYWIPIYSLNDKIREPYIFYVFAIFQTSIYILTGYILVRICWIFLTIKVFHDNMNIMMCWFLCQWFQAFLAKIVLIPYQFGIIKISMDINKTYYDWWSDTVEKSAILREDVNIWPIYFASYFLWHYMYSILFAVLAVGLERVCATWYIQ